MHSKAKSPTKAHRERWNRIRALGCIACRQNEPPVVLWPCEIHHLLDCGRRIGHDASVGLCAFHHRGSPPGNMESVKRSTEQFGPSLFHDGKGFHARYGTDKALLAYQNELLSHPEGSE